MEGKKKEKEKNDGIFATRLCERNARKKQTEIEEKE